MGGDNTDTLALLLESPNPAQGRLRGVTDAELVVGGVDPMYIKASERGGRLYVPYTDEGTPASDEGGQAPCVSTGHCSSLLNDGT